jgi:hypothetical protein
MAVLSVVLDRTSLSPWAGFNVLVGYAALSLLAGRLLPARRDA